MFSVIEHYKNGWIDSETAIKVELNRFVQTAQKMPPRV